MEAHLALLIQIQTTMIILVQPNFLDQNQAVNQNLADPRNQVEKTELMELGLIHLLHHLLTKTVQKDQSPRRDKSIQELDNL